MTILPLNFLNIRVSLLSIALLFLAACQTVGVSNFNKAIPKAAVKTSFVSYGKGPNIVAMIVSANAVNGTDYVDGARFALDGSAADLLTLQVYRTDGTARQSSQAILKAKAGGAKLILGPTSQKEVAEIVKLPNDQRPASIALVDGTFLNSGSGFNVFPFFSSSIDGILEASRVAAESGVKSFAVVYPKAQPSREFVRVVNGLRRNKSITATAVEYDKNFKILDKHKNQIKSADALVILGSNAEASGVLDVIAQQDYKNEKRVVIGSSKWSGGILGKASAQGAIIAKASVPVVGLIAEPFEKKFRRKPSVSVGYGFDLMAISSGLAKTGAFAKDVRLALLNPQGYRALSGLFRFHPSGNIERRHKVYQISGGQLKLIQEEGAGF